MSRSRTFSGVLAASALSAVVQAQQPILHFGFEARDANLGVVGWTWSTRGFEIVLDSVVPFAGRFSLRTRRVDATSDSAKSAVARMNLPATRAAGRRLHLSGYIRTDNIHAGYASLWIRAEGPGNKVLALDDMKERAPRGTTPWTRYDVEIPVDSAATSVSIGVFHRGDGSAWYDSLSVEVVGIPMARAVAAFRPEPRPPEDMTRLLTDAELALPRDSIAIREDSAYASWIRSHAQAIRSLGASDYSDLRFLTPLLTNKRIIQLGESSHGVAEFSMAKVRFIKYLHEELGYDVIAFESSIYECERAQRNIASLSPIALMRACINSVWHSTEILPLFEYIKETQATDHPLVLAGVDIQSTYSNRMVRTELFYSAVAAVDTSYARRVNRTDDAFLANPTQGYASTNKVGLLAFYDSLATFLRTNRRAIEVARASDPNIALIAKQAAVSAAADVRLLAATEQPGEIRDLAMADNLDFLLNELYRGRKVIVWAHNSHIRYHANAGTPPDSARRLPRSMGTWVAARHRRELYTIGLFMYRGSGAGNDRVPYPVTESRSGSFESILHQAPWRYSFVDFSNAKRERGSEWIWTAINGLDWGTTIERFVPRNEYDGVLFIDTVHPPNYR